ncbi:Hypothetical_protein [Hexamita inflata]|uniref:Hypothetical_protein n=1 Tax=Hexamita inflata TaxID=28002 RepID=A0AA86TL34_9EUKA|nr:Hypothetical protein HINF_LOCUS9494 [Hexamita inflata]
MYQTMESEAKWIYFSYFKSMLFQKYSQMVIATVIIALQTVTSITELSIFNYEHQCVTLLGFWLPAFYSSFVMWKNFIFHQQQQRSISSKNLVRIPKLTLLLKSTFVKNPHSRILGLLFQGNILQKVEDGSGSSVLTQEGNQI